MNLLRSSVNEVLRAVSSKDVQVTVVGLGKMGLPLSMCFAHAGFRVMGLDIVAEHVARLNRGDTDINEPYVAERLREAVSDGRFVATTDISEAVLGSSFVVVIIPVLNDDYGNVQLEGLVGLYRSLAECIDPGTVVIQESTLPPRTSVDTLIPVLSEGGKVDGVDFGYIFAPERTLSGRAVEDIEERYPKIIGPSSERAGDVGKVLYEQIAKKGVIVATDPTTAEAVKTFKGAYRDANIAIANQFAIIADKIGVDILEVIRIANTEPYSNIHTPGIGVGGHCIPVYPYFVIKAGEEWSYTPSVLRESRMANDFMVDYAIGRLDEVVPDWERNVLVLGLAYRNGVKEHRLSPTLRLVPGLRMKGISRLKVLDPLYTKAEVDAIFGDDAGFGYESWEEGISRALDWASVIIITTDHDEFKRLDYRLLSNKIIYDGRYVLNEVMARDFYLLQPGRLNISPP